MSVVPFFPLYESPVVSTTTSDLSRLSRITLSVVVTAYWIFTMPTITLNGELRPLPGLLTVAELLRRLGRDGARVAVEVNRDVVPLAQHGQTNIADGDRVEIVTLVGGGSLESPPTEKPLIVGR